MSALLNDEYLVVKAAAGDYQAFELLVQRYQGKIRGMLRNLCRDAAIADDLAQQTFIAAWEKLQQFRMGSFNSWLCTIAYRQFLMWQRQPHSHEAIEQTEQHVVELDPIAYKDLYNALGKLSESQRRAVVLTALVGLTHTEAAELLQQPVGTTKSHFSRGLKALKQLMRDA